MRVLVTGGTGILGTQVIPTLYNKGYEVLATRRPSSDTRFLGPLADHIQWAEADLLDLPVLMKLLEGVEAVVHCAALVSFRKRDTDLMLHTNEEGTANLVNACLEHRVSKFIHVSSVAALGKSKNQTIIDESAKWQESSLNSAYAESKYRAEIQVWRGEEEGLNVSVINPSVILGPGKWEASSMQLFKYVRDEGLFYPSGDVNYVDARDVARSIALLLESNHSGERFILNAGKVSYQRMFGLIAKQMNCHPPQITASKGMVQVAYALDHIKSMLLRKEPLITRDAIRLSRMDLLYSNEKIKNTLGFEFTNLEETIRWTCTELMNDFVKAK